MQKVKFVKMTGAGNDFVVIDKRLNEGLSVNTENIKYLCNRRNGIGADGLITISDSKMYDFTMEYYNADGSTGSLCGNGARCAIKYAEDSERLKNSDAKFLSNNTVYSGFVMKDGKYRLNLNPPADIKLNMELEVFSSKINLDFIDTGSPHVVINIDKIKSTNKEIDFTDLNNFPVYKLGKEIRYHKSFNPQGTNVNFIKINENKIFIRTYERGVENETLACGTGSVAAALISSINYKLSPPVSLITYGGDELIVDFRKEDEKFGNVSLTGPAVTVFSGEILLNNFD